jgi:hypothetical protein
MPDTMMTATTPATAAPAACSCGAPLERVRYFPRQLITAEDMRAEQHFFRERMKRHNLFLHGWGVVCGCRVVAAPTATQPWLVQVCPGYVVGPQGDEIVIPGPVSFDLQLGIQNPDPCAPAWPCPPARRTCPDVQQQVGWLAVRYSECLTRPVRVHPAGCGCDQLDCEYSRIRDSFELKLLWALPASHTAANQWDAVWRATLEKDRQSIREEGLPVPLCMPCAEDPWVVLARITIPTAAGQTLTAKPVPAPIAANDIFTNDRRVLLSTNALQVMTEVVGGI